jgi:hypothetical protein
MHDQYRDGKSRSRYLSSRWVATRWVAGQRCSERATFGLGQQTSLFLTPSPALTRLLSRDGGQAATELIGSLIIHGSSPASAPRFASRSTTTTALALATLVVGSAADLPPKIYSSQKESPPTLKKC